MDRAYGSFREFTAVLICDKYRYFSVFPSTGLLKVKFIHAAQKILQTPQNLLAII